MLKEMFLAGLGAVSLTKDKLEEIAQELIKRGELTAEDKNNFINNALSSVNKQKQAIKDKAYENFQQLAKEANLVTRDEYNLLLERVAELENKLNQANIDNQNM
ncbi:polyhydroxyalkanoate synthesis regulator phasin [Thermohydrogenium kirishiense]|nr:polyhydroxyalkanoate synthesis regulator phasin [Thermohydrogenium kirishiense]